MCVCVSNLRHLANEMNFYRHILVSNIKIIIELKYHNLSTPKY